MLRGQGFTFMLIWLIIESVVKATTRHCKMGQGIKHRSIQNRRPRRPIVTGFSIWSYNDRSIKIPHHKGSF